MSLSLQNCPCFRSQFEKFIYGFLEETVAITRASRLNLTIHSQNQKIKKLEKVLCSDHIQHLHISAPCTFRLDPAVVVLRFLLILSCSLVLMMKNLTEVTMEMSRSESPGGDCCTYQGSKKNDRRIHRAGLCIIHLGTLYGCPRLKNFNGINLGKFPLAPTYQTPTEDLFSKWNGKVKQVFYQDYLRSGGQLGLKSWSRRRWFSSQPSIPAVRGKARLPARLQ